VDRHHSGIRCDRRARVVDRRVVLLTARCARQLVSNLRADLFPLPIRATAALGNDRGKLGRPPGGDREPSRHDHGDPEIRELIDDLGNIDPHL